MLSYIKTAMEKWANWVGDRDLELALRKHLNKEGFFGDSAKFERVKLMAVERPGWVQVYTFAVLVRSRLNEDLPSERLFGVVCQDERKDRVEPKLFVNFSEQQKQLSDWSEGLIRLRQR